MIIIIRFNTSVINPAWLKYEITFSLSEIIAPIKTNANKKIEIFFAIGSKLAEKELKKFLITIPNKTGIVTIKNILIAISNTLISFVNEDSEKKSREDITIKGIVKTHNKLIIAVREIDKATSPFAKEVNIFEVAPPGAAAKIITPTAIIGFKGHTKTKINATRGKIKIWEKAPTIKSFGWTIILLKSLLVKPKPSENIINANERGSMISVTIPINKLYII